MPKRKPDQVVRLEFALNRTDREVVERYLLFEKMDRVSESIGQIITPLFASDAGLLSCWFLLDLIDDWAVPDDEFWRALGPKPGDVFPGVAQNIFEVVWRVYTGEGWTPVESAQEREGVTWANATKAQRRRLWPIRQKVNDVAKAGKWLIAGYFAMKYGDEWLTAIGGLLPSSEGVAALIPK